MAWALKSVAALSAMLGPFFTASTFVCAGATRAFRTPSQPVIRLVASLLPDMEVSQVRLPLGKTQTYLNGMYALMTEHGDIKWPKDNTRREIQFSEAEEKELRQQVLADMQALLERGEPLSPGWLRQLGHTAQALQVEAELAAPRGRKRKGKARALTAAQLRAPRVKKQKVAARPRFTKDSFEIERIVSEKKVSSKAKVLYLVRWAGYDPSWEALRISGNLGDQIETWEPRCLLQNTEALQLWKAARLQ